MRSRYILLATVLVTFHAGPTDAALTVDFEQLDPPTETTNPGGSGEYFNGYGFGAETGSWEAQGLTFPTREYGPGWSYSTVVDTETAGFSNQFAAFAGGGSDGSGNTVPGGTYAMANGNGSYFNLPELTRIESTRVTNSTYAAISMGDGDRFAKQFSTADGDFFSVTFEGWTGTNRGGTKTGEVEYFLADFRGDEGTIVDKWEYLDLSSLGDARSVGLRFASSDVGSFGINTPTYVAIDSLQITAVPEPGSLLALGVIAGVGVLVARVRRRRVRRPNGATANALSTSV